LAAKARATSDGSEAGGNSPGQFHAAFGQRVASLAQQQQRGG